MVQNDGAGLTEDAQDVDLDEDRRRSKMQAVDLLSSIKLVVLMPPLTNYCFVIILIFTLGIFPGQVTGEPIPKPGLDWLGDPLPEGALARLGTMRLRHGLNAAYVRFSEDGKSLLSWGWDGLEEPGRKKLPTPLFRKWDVATGKELALFASPDQEKTYRGFLKVLADGAMVALVDENEMLITRDIHGQETRHSNLDAKGFFYRFALSPTCKYLASRGREDEVRLWDISSGKILWKIPRALMDVGRFAFSRDGKYLAAGGWGDFHKKFIARRGKVILWESSTGREIFVKEIGLVAYPEALAFSPDGKWLAVGSVEGVSFFDVKTGEDGPKIRAPNTQWALTLSFSPDGKFLALGDNLPGTFRLFDIASGKELPQFSKIKSGGLRVAFSPDGTRLASYGGIHCGLVRLWDMATGKELLTFPGFREAARNLAFTPDGKILATSCIRDLEIDDNIRLWDARNWQPLRTIQGNKQFFFWQFSQDSKSLLFGDVTKSVQFWDVTSGKKVKELLREEKFEGFYFSWALEKTGKYMATQGEKDGVIRLWDFARMVEIQNWKGGAPPLAFSPDGKILASSDGNHTLRLWEIPSGKLRDSFPGPKNSIYRIVFAPDGQSLALVGKDGFLIKDFKTGETRWKVSNITGVFGGCPLAFSPDGKLLACGVKKDVVLWQIGKDLEWQRFRGHLNSVNALAFSPDGSVLVSTSSDSTALIWKITRNAQ